MSEFSTDVLVAGAGAAGLAAALAAADRGLQVVIVEAKETFRQGSNTAMSTSMVPAGGSRWQDAAGIEDSPELFYADVMAKTQTKAESKLIPLNFLWNVFYATCQITAPHDQKLSPPPSSPTHSQIK